MRVSLFELFPRFTNLMDLKIEFIQLVLPTSKHNTFNCCCLTCFDGYAHKTDYYYNLVLILFICIVHYLFACLEYMAQYSWTCVLPVHATLLHFSYSLGCFSDNPGPACPDTGLWNMVNFLS